MATDFGFRASQEDDYYFVSYNTEDSNRVGAVCSILKEQGLEIWYDEGIPHDSYWEGVLAEKICNCKEAIFFITKGIFEKGRDRALNEIFTYKEYDLAQIYDKKMLIVLMDQIDPKEEIPFSLISWWQEINPNRRQGVIAINEFPEQTAKKILKELSIEYKEMIGSWGPHRDVYTMEKPAKNPVMNSIVNNPTIGDERRFLRIGEINKETTNVANRDIYVKPGSRYLVYIYCHNACSSTYFDEDHNYSGAVIGLRISCNYPSSIDAGKSGFLYAKLLSENTQPKEVWARLKLFAESSVELILEKPARIYNDWKLNRSELPMEMFSDRGAFLGMDEFNGIMFGEESHCIVTFVLSVVEKAQGFTNDELRRLADALSEHKG